MARALILQPSSRRRQTHSGIKPGVEDVRQDGHDDDYEADDEDDSFQHWEVVLKDGGPRKRAEPGYSEHLLGYEDATHQGGKVESGHRDNGPERVPEGMVEDHTRMACTLRPGRAYVVF